MSSSWTSCGSSARSPSRRARARGRRNGCSRSCWTGSGRSARDREAFEVARVLGEELVPVVGDDDRVGVAEAADLVVVEPRLDGEHHPRLERRRVADVEERRLVVSEPGPVTGVLPPVLEEVLLLEVAD